MTQLQKIRNESFAHDPKQIFIEFCRHKILINSRILRVLGEIYLNNNFKRFLKYSPFNFLMHRFNSIIIIIDMKKRNYGFTSITIR
jgi:hypothetical protein